MKTTTKLLKFLILIIISSCYSANQFVDRIEDSHDALWYHTEALLVVNRTDKVMTLQSFANPVRTYELKGTVKGDTLLLTDQIRGSLKILKVKK